jgi:hypothetical protein
VKIAFDLDGTLDSEPALRELMKKLTKGGYKCFVLTGSHVSPVDSAEKDAKKAKLAQLGLDGEYHKLKVFPNPPGVAKAAYCKKHDIGLLIDNSLTNAQIAMRDTCVVVPWNTLTP